MGPDWHGNAGGRRRMIVACGLCLLLVTTVVGVLAIPSDGSPTAVWERTFDTNRSDDAFVSIVDLTRTDDGGYLLTGFVDDEYENRTAEDSDRGSPSDLLLIKTAPNGTMEWKRTYNYSYIELGVTAHQTTDGDFVIGGVDTFLKVDQDGDPVWQKWKEVTLPLGSVQSVLETTDGNLLIAGQTCCGPDRNVWIAKTTASGDVLWDEEYDLSNGSQSQFFGGMARTSDGYVIGTHSLNQSRHPTGEIRVLAVDGNGSERWRRTLRSGGYVDDIEFTDGRVAVTGTTEADRPWVGVLTEGGRVIRNRSYDVPLEPIAIKQFQDEYVIVGSRGRLTISENGSVESWANRPANATRASGGLIVDRETALLAGFAGEKADRRGWLAKVRFQTAANETPTRTETPETNVTATETATPTSTPTATRTVHRSATTADTVGRTASGPTEQPGVQTDSDTEDALPVLDRFADGGLPLWLLLIAILAGVASWLVYRQSNDEEEQP